jgi:signal transduction histidine kinase
MTEDSDRLEQLLNRMLRLARVEQWAADGIRRELEVVDIASTCEMAIARISELASSRDIKVEFAAAEVVLMRADPADLELIWLNLLENAVQYSPSGSSVRVLMDNDGDRVRVSVIDKGWGIPEADLEHIFDRFRRGDPSRSRTTGGFGLGLAIAKSIVQAYKGSIQAQSTIGEGTRISVVLPVLRTGSSSEVQSLPSNEDAPFAPR